MSRQIPHWLSLTPCHDDHSNHKSVTPLICLPLPSAYSSQRPPWLTGLHVSQPCQLCSPTPALSSIWFNLVTVLLSLPAMCEHISILRTLPGLFFLPQTLPLSSFSFFHSLFRSHPRCHYAERFPRTPQTWLKARVFCWLRLLKSYSFLIM